MKKQSKPKKEEPGELQRSRIGYAGLCGTVAGCGAAIARAQDGALDVLARLEYVKQDHGGMISAKGLVLVDEAITVFRDKWKTAYDANQLLEKIRAELRQPDAPKG